MSNDRSARTIDLPTHGTALIGRAPGCDVLIDDVGVSRKHAAIHVGDLAAVVEDLGSANGTTINGVRLTPRRPMPFRVGDTVAIESWQLLLQSAPSGGVARPVWQHEVFEGRLSEALRHTSAARAPIVLARIGRMGAVSMEQIIDRIDGVLDKDSVVGEYAPGELEILVRGDGALDPSAHLRRIRERLLSLCPDVVCAWSRTPADGTTAEALLAQACARLRPDESPTTAPPMSPDIILDSPQMQDLSRMIERVAKSGISVLLHGETGVGKEVIADLVHRRSPRSAGPFVRVNCAALSEGLLESELFGHEKGAFTGAAKEKLGLIEAANGGTLFLDEIGDVPLVAQVKLLRVLEERRVTRVGGLEPRPVDIRIVTATHRDLEQMAEQGQFRQDLYFRLSAIVITVPPLRDRVSDVAALARRFVAIIARRDGIPVPAISANALAALEQHSWPGNVRELRNVIERAVVLGGPHIEREHLSIRQSSPRRTEAPAPPHTETAPMRASAERGGDDTARIAVPGEARLQDEIRAIERQRIVDALVRCAGNQTEAAKLLGMSRRTFVSKLDQLGVPRPRKDAG